MMISYQAQAAPSAMGDAPRATFARRLRADVVLLLRLCDRQRQRRALLELDDHLLSDIGKSRREAREEGRKPFWR